MKKRICFAGFTDEAPVPGLLSSLKRNSSGSGSLWDCTFHDDGDGALTAAAAEPFDAVVMPLQLAGMAVNELLHSMGRFHPKTLRFVLGGVTDQELVLNGIGGTHQFIAQPCSAEELISTLRRSFALDTWLSSDQMRTLAPRLRRLPSLPSTYFEVLKQVESPSATVQGVSEVIARDPAVTARLLQMTNSAALALSQKITDPADAITLLGMETVKSLVICLQVFRQNESSDSESLSMEKLWDHSLAVANHSRRITRLQTGDPRLANEAFTAGLLHDVGRIVLVSNLPREYAAVVATAREQKRPLHEVEADTFGVNHAQVGAYLLGLWGMPVSLVESAALHHYPSRTSTRGFSLLSAVHAANVFAHEQDPAPDFPLPELDQKHFTTIGLAGRPAEWHQSIFDPERATTVDREADTAILPAETEPPTRLLPPPSAPPRAPTLREQFSWMALLAGSATAALLMFLYIQRGPNLVEQVRAKTLPIDLLPAASAPAPAPQPPPAPAPVAAPAPVKTTVPLANLTPAKTAAVPRDPFAAVKLQAIFYRAANSTAMINGKMFHSGDRFDRFQIISISPASVILATDHAQKVFDLH